MYEKECEQLGLPTPTCAADFPKSGWLTEEEINTDPAKLVRGYHARVRAETDRLFFIRKAESAAALAAGLPDPHEHLKADNPDCPSRTKVCGGPLAFSACPDCRAKRTPGMGFDDLDNEVFNEEPELEDPIADPTDLDLKAAADSRPEPCALSSEPCTPRSANRSSQRCDERGARTPEPGAPESARSPELGAPASSIRCPRPANRSSEPCALSSELCRPELCALSSDLCPELCALSSEPCPEVPKEKRYPPTCTKQTTCRAYPRGEGDTHPPCSCRSAVPGALHHTQEPAPRPHRIPVLMREDPRDLVQMRHVVRGPGSQ
jgi:hypothetical protein